MSNHASAGGTVARTGQRSCNDAVATLSPKARDSERNLIPSNIYEQRALDAAQLLQGEVELVLALKCRQPLQHRGRQDGTRLQRRDQTQHLVPVLANHLDPEASPE
jgi:hypothetical protein